MPSLIKTGRIIKELLASSTALFTATLVAALLAQNATTVKRAQISSPLDGSKTTLQTLDRRRLKELDFDAEIPLDSLLQSDLEIPDEDLLLLHQLSIAHAGHDAIKLWNDKDALALNRMENTERHCYLNRLQDESRIGSTLADIVYNNDGQFHKFDHRFKAPASVYETLHVRPDAPKNVMEISDLVRYSVLFDNNHYTQATMKSLDSLEKNGFKIESVWNAWADSRYPYNAVNAVLKDAQHGSFEIQFHTPQGAKINDSTHKMYEERRLFPKGSAEYEQRLQAQQSLANQTLVPKDALNIPDLKKTAKKQQFAS